MLQEQQQKTIFSDLLNYIEVAKLEENANYQELFDLEDQIKRLEQKQPYTVDHCVELNKILLNQTPGSAIAEEIEAIVKKLFATIRTTPIPNAPQSLNPLVMAPPPLFAIPEQPASIVPEYARAALDAIPMALPVETPISQSNKFSFDVKTPIDLFANDLTDRINQGEFQFVELAAQLNEFRTHDQYEKAALFLQAELSNHPQLQQKFTALAKSQQKPQKTVRFAKAPLTTTTTTAHEFREKTNRELIELYHTNKSQTDNTKNLISEIISRKNVCKIFLNATRQNILEKFDLQPEELEDLPAKAFFENESTWQEAADAHELLTLSRRLQPKGLEKTLDELKNIATSEGKTQLLEDIKKCLKSFEDELRLKGDSLSKDVKKTLLARQIILQFEMPQPHQAFSENQTINTLYTNLFTKIEGMLSNILDETLGNFIFSLRIFLGDFSRVLARAKELTATKLQFIRGQLLTLETDLLTILSLTPVEQKNRSALFKNTCGQIEHSLITLLKLEEIVPEKEEGRLFNLQEECCYEIRLLQKLTNFQHFFTELQASTGNNISEWKGGIAALKKASSACDSYLTLTANPSAASVLSELLQTILIDTTQFLTTLKSLQANSPNKISQVLQDAENSTNLWLEFFLYKASDSSLNSIASAGKILINALQTCVSLSIPNLTPTDFLKTAAEKLQHNQAKLITLLEEPANFSLFKARLNALANQFPRQQLPKSAIKNDIPDSPILLNYPQAKREPLNITADELSLLNLPPGFAPGTSVNNCGCFFHSLAEILNYNYKTAYFNEEILREICFRFYCQHPEVVTRWLQGDNNAQTNTANLTAHKDYRLVLFTLEQLDQIGLFRQRTSQAIFQEFIQRKFFNNSEEINAFFNKNAIWGGHVEAQILCAAFKDSAIIKTLPPELQTKITLDGMHIIEIHPKAIADEPNATTSTKRQLTYQWITAESDKGVEKPVYPSDKLPIVLAVSELHFVPVLPATAKPSLQTQLPPPSVTQLAPSKKRRFAIVPFMENSNGENSSAARRLFAPTTTSFSNSTLFHKSSPSTSQSAPNATGEQHAKKQKTKTPQQEASDGNPSATNSYQPPK